MPKPYVSILRTPLCFLETAGLQEPLKIYPTEVVDRVPKGEEVVGVVAVYLQFMLVMFDLVPVKMRPWLLVVVGGGGGSDPPFWRLLPHKIRLCTRNF